MDNIQKVIITELRRRSMKKSILFSTGSVSGVINNHFMAGVKKGVTPKAVSQVAEKFFYDRNLARFSHFFFLTGMVSAVL